MAGDAGLVTKRLLWLFDGYQNHRYRLQQTWVTGASRPGPGDSRRHIVAAGSGFVSGQLPPRRAAVSGPLGIGRDRDVYLLIDDLEECRSPDFAAGDLWCGLVVPSFERDGEIDWLFCDLLFCVLCSDAELVEGNRGIGVTVEDLDLDAGCAAGLIVQTDKPKSGVIGIGIVQWIGRIELVADGVHMLIAVAESQIKVGLAARRAFARELIGIHHW